MANGPTPPPLPEPAAPTLLEPEPDAADAPPTLLELAVAAATHLAEQAHTLPHLEVRGLMAMGPLTDDVTRIRQVFTRVRELFDEVVGTRLCGPQFTELSLGMSQDFEYAIEVGATYIRVGSAFFEGIELPVAVATE